MWFKRSVLIWLYSILSVLNLVFGGFDFALCLGFAAHLGLLYYLTAPYENRKKALSALRCRMVVASICSNPIQTVVISFTLAMFTSLVVGFALAIKFADKFQGLDPTDSKNFTKEVQDWTNQTLESWTPSQNGTDPIGKQVLFTAGPASLNSVWETLLSWVLTKGYLAMVTSYTEGRIEVEIVEVFDILSFGLVGAVGVHIGGAFFKMIARIVVRILGGSLPPSSEVLWWDPIFVRPWKGAIALSQSLTSVAYLALATASWHVIGISSNMTLAILKTFGFNFLVEASMHGVNKDSWTTKRLIAICRFTFATVCIALMAKACWKRYRLLSAHEAAKKRSRILTATI